MINFRFKTWPHTCVAVVGKTKRLVVGPPEGALDDGGDGLRCEMLGPKEFSVASG